MTLQNSYTAEKVGLKENKEESYPSRLFVETTTRCNLSCQSCVKQSEGCKIDELDLPPETFNHLIPLFPNLSALILNGIGEPLLNKHLETFIKTARSYMPKGSWIGFQSNGKLLTNLRAVSLVDAGLNRICFSVDAVSPETFQNLRKGEELRDIEAAISAMKYAKNLCNRRDLEIGIEYVAMPENINQLPATIRWGAEHGATFAIVTHVLQYDESSGDGSLFTNCSKEVVDLFRKTSELLALEGLSIANYFEARWKYRRTEEEKRVVEAVEKMRIEGEELGFFIDMKKLLSINLPRLDMVSKTFKEAKKVANECGISLTLPEITLSSKRRCDFVEDRGIFVSVDGEVSPCYFLWHNYSCFANGWKQTIKQKTFGNVMKKDVLSIWNSPEYSSFREQVLKYDYPECANCSLSPCDYVQNESFEQDCHVGSVPCGSCLWCMGVFHCMR